MLKKMATVFGVVMLLVGVLGFIPGITTSDGLLLGIFHVNALHNIIHLLTGAVALYVGMSGYKASKMYFQVFGVVYALVSVLGFVYMDKNILGLVSSNMADTILHVVIALVALYLGFGSKEESMATA
jgi:hypothetical protein